MIFFHLASVLFKIFQKIITISNFTCKAVLLNNLLFLKLRGRIHDPPSHKKGDWDTLLKFRTSTLRM